MASKIFSQIIFLFFFFCISFCFSQKKESQLKDGVYKGKTSVALGKAKVEITIKEGKIADVKILTVSGFDWRKKAVMDSIPLRVIAKNSLDVDVVSGATGSSLAAILAMKRALKKAYANPDTK